MANFAKAQLMKYGWTEGKGLGKNENGITEALKPKLKFDTVGIGHKDTDSNQWWEAAFNKAASNVIVDSQNNGVTFSVEKKQVEQTNVKKLKGASKYGNFLKTSTLCDGNLIQENSVDKVESEVENIESNFAYSQLTDEELFKACGGRTAHKGARHGLTLNGKLARIAEQERKLLSTVVSGDISEANLQSHKDCDKYKSLRLYPESQEDDSNADSNANTILSSALVMNNRHVLKKYQKRQTRRIINLTHQLDALCNINEGDKEAEDHASGSVTGTKKKQLKRKRSKDRKESTNLNLTKDAPEEEVDNEICKIPLPPNEGVEQKKVKQKKKKALDNDEIDVQGTEQTENYSGEELIYAYVENKKKKKSKKKRSHSRQSRSTVFTEQDQEGQYSSKKLKKSHSKKDNLELFMKDKDIETEQEIDLSSEARQLPDEVLESISRSEEYYSELCNAYTKRTAKFLNARINKSKHAKLRRKQLIKMDRITESLKAVHFDADVSAIEMNAKPKSDTVITEVMKMAKKHKKHKKNKLIC